MDLPRRTHSAHRALPDPTIPVQGNADRVRMEAQRLRTGGPSYSDCWRAAKAQGWACRRIALYWPAWFPVWVGFDYLLTGDGGNGLYAVTMLLAGLLALPYCLWRVYHRALKGIDSHKATAFEVGSYAALAVGLRLLSDRPRPLVPAWQAEYERRYGHLGERSLLMATLLSMRTSTRAGCLTSTLHVGWHAVQSARGGQLGWFDSDRPAA